MMSLLVLLSLITPATEVTRIQSHLAQVDQELRAADVSRLSSEQRARRAALIDELARYRTRAVFPRNVTVDRQTPFFVDDRGVRCAMANLIETHGGAALVARVAATANNAYVRELASDPELRGWLAVNGLTAQEAARIQPAYPKQPGARCTGNSICSQSTCVQALDEPGLSFCSPPCDPAVGGCPIGIEGIAMECQAQGDRYGCVYPQPSPGSLGWPCDAETASSCIYACSPLDDQRGECVPACSNTQACPDGYRCSPELRPGEADHLRECKRVENRGCSATTPSMWLLSLLVPLLRRRSANRARPSASGRR